MVSLCLLLPSVAWSPQPQAGMGPPRGGGLHALGSQPQWRVSTSVLPRSSPSEDHFGNIPKVPLKMQPGAACLILEGCERCIHLICCRAWRGVCFLFSDLMGDTPNQERHFFSPPSQPRVSWFWADALSFSVSDGSQCLQESDRELQDPLPLLCRHVWHRDRLLSPLPFFTGLLK